MIKLTENFTLEELCVTDTGLENVPNDCQKEKLQILASMILQPIRNKWGRIRVNSGFRSESVNHKIGGSATSQHCQGEAADIKPLDADIDEVFEWCRENLIYGQLINEHSKGSRWLHISLPRLGKINQMVMIFSNGAYTNV